MPFPPALHGVIQSTAEFSIEEFHMRNQALAYLWRNAFNLKFDIIGPGPGPNPGVASWAASQVLKVLADPRCEPFCQMVLMDSGIEPKIDKIWVHCELSDTDSNIGPSVKIGGEIIHLYQNDDRWDDFTTAAKLIGMPLARRYYDFQADPNFLESYRSAVRGLTTDPQEHFVTNFVDKILTHKRFIARIWSSEPRQRPWQSLIQKEIDRLHEMWRHRDPENGG